MNTQIYKFKKHTDLASIIRLEVYHAKKCINKPTYISSQLFIYLLKEELKAHYLFTLGEISNNLHLFKAELANKLLLNQLSENRSFLENLFLRSINRFLRSINREIHTVLTAMDITNINAANNRSDEKLMLSFSLGDAAAFESLYLKHKGAVFRYFNRQINNKEIAEELHQETWIKIINSKDSYSDRAKFTTFLFHIARNLLIDYFRKSSTKLEQASISPKSDQEDDYIFDQQNDSLNNSPEEIAITSSNIELFNIFIREIPQKQKEALLLRIDSGLSVEEIAEITKSSKEAVKSRIRYAVGKITSRFEEVQNE